MKEVTITEVGPRDGFQSVSKWIPTELKLEIMRKILASGVGQLQAGSFVSSKAIPQMADANAIFQVLKREYPALEPLMLTPNARGAEHAVSSGVHKISYVISVSESHNQKNVNRSCQASFQELAGFLETRPRLEICLDAATAFGCPFEGLTPTARLTSYLDQAVELGIRHFCICDTIGIATPGEVRHTMGLVLNRYPDAVFEVHLHDTRNMGMAGTLAAIESGVTRVQTSLGGLGGCPFAPGASGNTATEDLVYMLDRMGYSTGIDFEQLMEAARFLFTQVEGYYSGHQLRVKSECCG